MQESHHLSPRAFGDNPTLRHKEADAMILLKICPDFLALAVTRFLLAALPHSRRGWPPAPAGGRVEDEGGRVAGLGRKSISLLNHL